MLATKHLMLPERHTSIKQLSSRSPTWQQPSLKPLPFKSSPSIRRSRKNVTVTHSFIHQPALINSPGLRVKVKSTWSEATPHTHPHTPHSSFSTHTHTHKQPHLSADSEDKKKRVSETAKLTFHLFLAEVNKNSFWVLGVHRVYARVCAYACVFVWGKCKKFPFIAGVWHITWVISRVAHAGQPPLL